MQQQATHRDATTSGNTLSQHLRDVDETYFEHMAHALGFGLRMIVGGLACLIHGLLPFTFVKTGSACISQLHDRMVVNRLKPGVKPGGALD